MKKAFTLVELLVSLTIMGLFLGSVFYALGVELRFWDILAGQAAGQQRFEAVAARMIKDIRAADQIQSGSDGSTLSLKIGRESLVYSLSNGKVRRQKGAGAAYLTDDGEVGSLSFAYPSARSVTVSLDGLDFLVALRN